MVGISSRQHQMSEAESNDYRYLSFYQETLRLLGLTCARRMGRVGTTNQATGEEIMTYDELAEEMTEEHVNSAIWEASERAREAYWTRLYEIEESGNSHE